MYIFEIEKKAYISQYSFCLPNALDSVLQDKMDFTKLLFYSKVFFFFLALTK